MADIFILACFLLFCFKEHLFERGKQMQHFGYVVCFFWKSLCNEPPLREIRDSMGAIRSFWTIFRLDQNRGHCKLTLYIFFIYGMNKLTEYWTWGRCKIVGKIKSLLIDSHSAGLCNLNPLSMARACPLFLHMCAVLEMRRGRKVEISGIYYSFLMARTSWKLRKRAKGTWHFTIGSNSRN